MGVWAETCAISNLPIRCDHPGEEVVFLLVAQSPFSFNEPAVYGPNDQYFVRTLPVYAKYDSYGSIEVDDLDPVDKKIIELMVEQFKLDLVESEEHRKDKLKSFRTLQEWFHNSQVFIREHKEEDEVHTDRPALRCLPVMVRRDVWDSLLCIQTDVWDSRLSLDKYRSITAEYLEGLVGSRALHQHITSAQEIPEENKETILKMTAGMMSLKFKSLPGTHLIHDISSPAFFINWISDKMVRGRNVDMDRTTSFLDRYTELSYINHVMRTVRKCWVPTGGAGSQNVSEPNHIQFHLRCAVAAYNTWKRDTQETLSKIDGTDYVEEELEREQDRVKGMINALCDRLKS